VRSVAPQPAGRRVRVAVPASPRRSALRRGHADTRRRKRRSPSLHRCSIALWSSSQRASAARSRRNRRSAGEQITVRVGGATCHATL
jgi:hypothetical protein